MTTQVAAFVALAFLFLCWLSTGHTPLLLLARLAMLLEVAFASALNIAWAGVLDWAGQLWVRYDALRYAEAPLIPRAPDTARLEMPLAMDKDREAFNA